MRRWPRAPERWFGWEAPCSARGSGSPHLCWGRGPLRLERYLPVGEHSGKYPWSWKELTAGLAWAEFSLLGTHQRVGKYWITGGSNGNKGSGRVEG